MLSNKTAYDIPAFTAPSVTIATVTPWVLNTTSEVQTITVVASAGTFTITFGWQTTSALAYNVSAAAMQTALWALSSIADNDVVVTLSGNVYTLTWVNTLGDVAAPTATITGLYNVVGRWLTDGFQNSQVTLIPDGTPNYKLWFAKSYQELAPNFGQTATSTNLWDLSSIVDLDSGSTIAGATWVAISATTTRTAEWNLNGSVWVAIMVSAYVSGNLTGRILLTQNV